ncbi:MAG TPA: dockerin type I domain-containing protein, partial [Acidobacteriaceae bacterium]|nr:dockerin type I domain-containing protein [Acidobacteriaceae bacterium]
RWNGGASWSPLQGGMGGSDPQVRALITYNNELIAGGDFVTGVAGDTYAYRIARWNGAFWWHMGSGFSGTIFTPWVSSLTIFNHDLIAAGTFATSGGTNVNRIARWDGPNWQPLGSGLDDEVRTLTTFRNELIVGGLFDSAGGDFSAHDWARWGPTCPTGDMNCDQIVDMLDIEPLVAALLDPRSLNSCMRLVADANFDSVFNARDIAPFVSLISP